MYFLESFTQVKGSIGVPQTGEISEANNPTEYLFSISFSHYSLCPYHWVSRLTHLDSTYTAVRTYCQ